MFVGYRTLARERTSGGLVSGIGEAVTQTPAARRSVGGAGRRTWGGPEGTPHESCESREGDEARPATYQLPRSSTLCRAIVKTMYRWPASSKQTTPLTSSQIRYPLVITMMLWAAKLPGKLSLTSPTSIDSTATTLRSEHSDLTRRTGNDPPRANVRPGQTRRLQVNHATRRAVVGCEIDTRSLSPDRWPQASARTTSSRS